MEIIGEIKQTFALQSSSLLGIFDESGPSFQEHLEAAKKEVQNAPAPQKSAKKEEAPVANGVHEANSTKAPASQVKAQATKEKEEVKLKEDEEEEALSTDKVAAKEEDELEEGTLLKDVSDSEIPASLLVASAQIPLSKIEETFIDGQELEESLSFQEDALTAPISQAHAEAMKTAGETEGKNSLNSLEMGEAGAEKTASLTEETAFEQATASKELELISGADSFSKEAAALTEEELALLQSQALDSAALEPALMDGEELSSLEQKKTAAVSENERQTLEMASLAPSEHLAENATVKSISPLAASREASLKEAASTVIPLAEISLPAEGKEEIAFSLEIEAGSALKGSSEKEQLQAEIEAAFAASLDEAKIEEEATIASDGQKILQLLAEIANQTDVKEPLFDKLAPHLQKAVQEQDDLMPLSRAPSLPPTPVTPPLSSTATTATALQSLEESTPLEKLRTKVVQQVQVKLRLLSKDGKGEIAMRLTPPMLGNLKIKISLDGLKAKAHFIAENQSVKELLEQSFENLRDSLANQGIELSSLEISTAGQGQAQNGGQGFQSGETQKVARDWLYSLHNLADTDSRLDQGQKSHLSTESEDLINIMA